MTPSGRVQAVIDLIDTIQYTDKPADALVSDYFRSHRYIGSSDRREISFQTYEILRNIIKFQTLGRILKGDKELTARELYLLYIQQTQQNPDLDHLFSGYQYAPSQLSSQEIAFLTRLKKVDLSQLPPYAEANCPEFLYEILKEVFGSHFNEEMKALNCSASLDIRINTLKATKEDVKRDLISRAILSEDTPFSPYGLRLESRRPLGDNPLWKNGEIEVQDEGSQLVALLSEVAPGQRILDYCAGAGGKTLAFAMLMENKGHIVASDVYDWRLKRAKLRARKAGCHNIDYRLIQDNEKWFKRQKEKFDCVLIDVPCSGSGTWRRNPDLKIRFTSQDLAEVLKKQQEILEKACDYVKPGGRLIYSTCSLLPQENREQIERFLAVNPYFYEIKVEDVWKKCLGTSYPGTAETSLQLTPFRSNTDGFFICIMERKFI